MSNPYKTIYELRETIAELSERCREQEADIEELLKEHKWISVEDRLPNEYGDVLVFRVYNQRTMMSVDTYDTDRKRFSKYHNCGITHWMPLPTPPESEDNAE